MDLAEEVSQLVLVDITDASAHVSDAVLATRNEADVRKNMYTTHIISPSEHEAWIERLRASKNASKFFAVMKGGSVIGGVGVSGINAAHRRADWAYYLSSSAQGRGTGSALEFKFLDYVFRDLGLFKLNCEVIDWNKSVIKLHKRFGFTEEGERRAHVWRDNEPHNVVLLGINQDEWQQTRAELTQKLFAGA